MSERAAVTVVGIGDDGWDGLTETARAALQQAPMIVGSTRQLGLLPDLGVRRQPLPSPLLSQLDDLVASNPGLCLLASGDPMLHGLGATLARRLGAGRLRVLPAVSSVALACARLGWAGHEVDMVSLVSRPVEAVLPAVQPGGRAIVLCRDGGTPAALARLLADRAWGDSELTVLEHLGGEAEQVTGPVRAAAGTRVRAHEFHRTVSDPTCGDQPAWELAGGGRHGWASPSLLASYLHLHWAGVPGAATRLVGSALAGRMAGV